MRIRIIQLFIVLLIMLNLDTFAQAMIIDHNCTKLKSIPISAITTAKLQLHIAYGHTSHGSQIITGMNNLDAFMGETGLYEWDEGTREGYLDIDDYFVSGDLGNPDRSTWALRTRDYLNNSNNIDVNVIMWSWCGQVSSATEDDIDTYLNLMTQLETDFPNINFVYMTGHLDGTGLTGNLHLRNEQIRNYCIANNKILFDFADIECYDPDGNYFGNKNPNDNCDYDSDGNGSRDANWAIEWQNSHVEGIDWYSCGSAHSQSLNANQKAYAAWWLWATLAGWNETTAIVNQNNLSKNFTLRNNYPNPFNPETNILFFLDKSSHVIIEVFDLLGNKVKTLTNNNYAQGEQRLVWNGLDELGNKVNSGIYIYRITSDKLTESKRMVLLK